MTYIVIHLLHRPVVLEDLVRAYCPTIYKIYQRYTTESVGKAAESPSAQRRSAHFLSRQPWAITPRLTRRRSYRFSSSTSAAGRSPPKWAPQILASGRLRRCLESFSVRLILLQTASAFSMISLSRRRTLFSASETDSF